MSEKNFCRYIYVKFQFEDLHRYEDAPDQVAFLRNWHRHVFKVKCTIGVTHNERELEFFMVKDRITQEVLPYIRLRDLGSCETIAKNLLNGLINLYGDQRQYIVKVSEDNENGALLSYVPSS